MVPWPYYKLNVLIFSKSLNGDIGAVCVCSSWLVFHKVVRSLTSNDNFCLNMLSGEFDPAFRFSFFSMFYDGCS